MGSGGGFGLDRFELIGGGFGSGGSFSLGVLQGFGGFGLHGFQRGGGIVLRGFQQAGGGIRGGGSFGFGVFQGLGSLGLGVLQGLGGGGSSGGGALGQFVQLGLQDGFFGAGVRSALLDLGGQFGDFRFQILRGFHGGGQLFVQARVRGFQGALFAGGGLERGGGFLLRGGQGRFGGIVFTGQAFELRLQVGFIRRSGCQLRFQLRDIRLQIVDSLLQRSVFGHGNPAHCNSDSKQHTQADRQFLHNPTLLCVHIPNFVTYYNKPDYEMQLLSADSLPKTTKIIRFAALRRDGGPLLPARSFPSFSVIQAKKTCRDRHGRGEETNGKCNYTQPCASMASATLRKPAIFAPTT